MSLNNPSEYHQYSYINEKEEISKRLSQGFIDGIINASKYRGTLKMKTHSWMVREVINSNEIQSRFDIKIIVNPIKTTKLIAEVLILFSKEEFEKNIEYAHKVATKERDSCDIILQRIY